MEMSQIRGEVVSLINYYSSMEDKIKDLTTLLHLLNKSPHLEPPTSQVIGHVTSSIEN